MLLKHGSSKDIHRANQRNTDEANLEAALRKVGKIELKECESKGSACVFYQDLQITMGISAFDLCEDCGCEMTPPTIFHQLTKKSIVSIYFTHIL
jgi:hypothetical protein